MSIDDTTGGAATLSPDDAFAVLGDETRLAILRTLGEAETPLAFGDLRQRVGYDASGNFSYHLDKLAGHFVEKNDEGYALRRAGQRVVEAVLSGVVTDAPELERTRIDWPCPNCGAPSTQIAYRQEQVGVFCTACEGLKDGTDGADEDAAPLEQRRIGGAHLPPAGLRDRTPPEVLQAALVWTAGEVQTAVNEVCPRCSAPVEVVSTVCGAHDATGGLCDNCGQTYAATFEARCSNCVYEIETVFGVYLLAQPELRRFLIEQGLNPVAPTSHRFWEMFQYEEDIQATDPFDAKFTFTVDDEALVLTVDEELTVVDVLKR